MKYDQLSCIEFHYCSYSNASQFTSLIKPLTVIRRVLLIKVCLSLHPEVFLKLASLFFLELNKVSCDVMALCVTEPDFSKIILLPEKWGKWTKHRVIWTYWKNSLLRFSEFGLKWKFASYAAFLNKSNIWEKLGSYMSQNVLRQWDWRIFKSSYL